MTRKQTIRRALKSGLVNVTDAHGALTWWAREHRRLQYESLRSLQELTGYGEWPERVHTPPPRPAWDTRALEYTRAHSDGDRLLWWVLNVWGDESAGEVWYDGGGVWKTWERLLEERLDTESGASERTHGPTVYPWAGSTSGDGFRAYKCGHFWAAHSDREALDDEMETRTTGWARQAPWTADFAIPVDPFAREPERVASDMESGETERTRKPGVHIMSLYVECYGTPDGNVVDDIGVFSRATMDYTSFH